MKPKTQNKRLLLAKQSVAKLEVSAQQMMVGGTAKTNKTIADPVEVSLVWLKGGCVTDTSCNLYVCMGTGPI